MGQFFSKISLCNGYCRRVLFLLLLITPTISFAQSSYTSNWFVRQCKYCQTHSKNLDSILQDVPENAWHNAHTSFYKKDYTKADYYLLKDTQTKDEVKEIFQGQIFLRLKVYKDAKEHFQNMTATENLDLRQFVYKSLGNLYYIKRQYDSAQVYYQKAFQVPILQSRYFKTEIYENIAYIKLSKKQFLEADSMYKKVLDIYKKHNDSSAIARTYSNVGNSYYQQYKDNIAKQYFDSAYTAVKPLNDLQLKQSITDNLYLVNDILRNHDDAVKYLKENMAITDSLRKQNHLWEVAKQKEAFAVAKKQSEVDVKTAERNSFIIISIAVVLILIIGFFVYKRLSKQHQEIRKLNAKLDKLNTAKDQLFTIIAHDLRSPVALLKQAFQLQSFQQKESFSTLDTDVPKILDSLSMLLDNLLNWALSQSSLLHVQKDWFPLQPVLQQIHNQYDALMTEKDIRFSLNISRSVLVYGDMELLKVALRNCLDNAIKFTPKGGSIQFSETIENEQYTLSLIDSGIGIPEELLAKIFEMNSRKIQKDTTGRKSSGLGLLLTKSMIQLNDGKIQIKRNPGGGTIIDISIPYKKIA